jgi:hypothetical protein
MKVILIIELRMKVPTRLTHDTNAIRDRLDARVKVEERKEKECRRGRIRTCEKMLCARPPSYNSASTEDKHAGFSPEGADEGCGSHLGVTGHLGEDREGKGRKT